MRLSTNKALDINKYLKLLSSFTRRSLSNLVTRASIADSITRIVGAVTFVYIRVFVML